MFHKLFLLDICKIVYPFISRNYSVALNKQNMGMPVGEIIKTLQSFAPLSLAENWDNVGLLVDPMTNKKVHTVFLTNDLTEDIVDEAKKVDAGLIVTYHPNIFQGLKTVSSSTWKERIVVQCIRHEIAVFSPHTSWDSVEGGVNDWLATAFQFKEIKPIKEMIENPRQGSGRSLILQSPQTVESIVTQVKKHLGIERVRLALARNGRIDSMVHSIALCAGSGGSVLNGVEANLYLTGEMSHHDVLDATQKGIHVILCEHSNSERGFLRDFQNVLKRRYLQNQINVVVSQLDKDPLVSF